MGITRLKIVGFSVLSLMALLAWALPAGAHPARATGTTVNVISGKPSEYHFTLSVKSVATGTVTFKLTNRGTVPHDLKLCSSPKGGHAMTCTGHATPLISPGATATLKVTFKTAGTYEYLCTFPGHAALGMIGDLKVT
jgi:uncharacterized cupredoxin-like copper-binding protein